MYKTVATPLAVAVLLAGLVGCTSAADRANENLTKAALKKLASTAPTKVRAAAIAK